MLVKKLRKQPSSGAVVNAASHHCSVMNFYHVPGFCVVRCITDKHTRIIFHFMQAINCLIPPHHMTSVTHFPTVLWTAQGHFLVENSEASTINRNTGMFWALLQCRYAPKDTLMLNSGQFSGNRSSNKAVTSTHYFV